MTRRSPIRGAKVPETVDPAYYEALGRAIKVARTELGLSRKELAAMAGISYPYVADIESGRGRPSSSALLAVAGALGMSPSELMASAEFFADRMQEEPGSAPADEMALPAPAREGRSWFRGDTPVMEKMPSRRASLDEPGPPRPREELHRLIDELPDDDVPLALDLARRLLGESPPRPR